MFIADLHIHSKYSRATSPSADLEHIAESAKIKGIRVVGTGDFTHPEWIKEIEEKLEPAEQGLFKLKKSQDEIRFLLSSEISCIYSYKEKVRKVHNIIFAPSLEAVEKINKTLSKIGNIHSDGRPILGLNSKELLKIVLEADENCLFVPAHCMTPWFAIFGSKSGFDSIEECFDDYSKYIFALETGLSADPSMIWRIPDGRRVALISNSDAHSPEKLGREANVFDTDLSYAGIIEAIKSKDPKKFLYTIEFFPEEGKYHYDGHRACEISLSPIESKKYNNVCPVCGKPLTLGVVNRISKLSDKEEGFIPKGAVPFKSLIPLKEVIAEALGCGVSAKKVVIEYDKLINEFKNEFNILLNVEQSDLENIASIHIAEGIIRARQGRVNIEPGYDGVFGKVRIFSELEKKNLIKQKVLI
ncbi:endonuclease Q family protein [Patescibacteria group bacterium]|nr:endonuclease Q family protein [Patescibacteria group bacterium]MBU4162140.1 endonuclease Q family protein [Patescibacteria group bacterium]